MDPEIVIPARTSTATATGNPLPAMPGTSDWSYGRELYPRSPAAILGKRRDQFVGADVIRVMCVPNSRSLPGSPQ